MEIVNKYISIKLGDKSVTKHNFILDSYLKYFSKGQLEEYSYMNNRKNLSNYLYIKLDEPLENITTESTLSANQFEMYIYKGGNSSIKNKSNITVLYTFSNEISYYLNNEEQTDRSLLDGRKITGLSYNLETYLDVSDYDLYFIGDEILTILREDVISTDAYIDGYDYPYHLSPVLDEISYESAGETYYADVYSKIYSVGLGYNIGKMEEEYIIDEDIRIIEEDDTTFSFNLKKANDVGVYPNNNGYPSTSTFPLTFRIKTSKYPSTNLYTSNNLYPSVGDYKYIIIKYRLYYIDRGSNIVNLNDFYTMSFYTNKEGILTIKDKIERND